MPKHGSTSSVQCSDAIFMGNINLPFVPLQMWGANKAEVTVKPCRPLYLPFGITPHNTTRIMVYDEGWALGFICVDGDR